MNSDRSTESPGADSLAKLRHHQHIVRDFSQLLASYIPFDQLLPLVAIRLARGLGVQHSMILRYDSVHGDLQLAAGVGWPPQAVGTTRFAIEATNPAGRTQQTRLPTFVDDLRNTDEFRIPALLQRHGIRSLVNVPVICSGTLWGVLEMDSTEPGRFDADDAHFLLSMANLLGIAIERSADHATATAAAAVARAEAKAVQDAQSLRLDELQHRIKNNLAVIASMLLLEQYEHSDSFVKARLRGLMDRVMAIGLAHEHLAIRLDGAVVAVEAYISRLAHAASLQHVDIRLETDLQSVVIPLDRAVPLGLIVNELITNATKYAFPDGSGTIQITLHRDPETAEATLVVADDGVGMKGKALPGNLGTRLITRLAAQINGTIQRPDTERGTRVEILFPAPQR
ncbi:two-component sensor histidine kinase [Azospirillum sp. OGB3]|uniref:GAF domain-containing protein n=1 Tax=Azospirillum sp. OGB3 TaxID=2587012 RepID=UPI001606A504|nr:GAF domain-containing protein [Azospirillum sp. OGB3]MBB3264897.1 two-component sensor histidine kinase [Azospirillum sp. OGB3]